MHTYDSSKSYTTMVLIQNIAASLIPYGTLFRRAGGPQSECCIVVDSGFSFTHVIPIIENQIVWNAVKRYEVYSSEALLPRIDIYLRS